MTPDIIRQQTTAQLLQVFDATDHCVMTPELGMVRGWLMDELETRDNTAFAAWVESNEDSPFGSSR